MPGRKIANLLQSGNRHLSISKDSGTVARVDVLEIAGRVVRDGLAAIRAVAHVDANGHAARLAADSVAVIATIRYRTWPEAHGALLSSSSSLAAYAVDAAFVGGAAPLVLRAPTAGDAVEILVGELHALFLGELEQLLGGVARTCLVFQFR